MFSQLVQIPNEGSLHAAMKTCSLVNNISPRYEVLVEFLNDLGVLLFVTLGKCERFENMFCPFSHGVNKGIYQKNLVFFVELRSTSELLKTLLPIQPLLKLCEVELLWRVELQHFSSPFHCFTPSLFTVSLLHHFTALPLHHVILTLHTD